MDNIQVLVGVDGTVKGQRWTIGVNPVTIGSGSDNVIVIDKDASVSKKHALISDMGGMIIFSDLGSETGSFINGQKSIRSILAHKDSIRIGSCLFQLMLKEEEVQPAEEKKVEYHEDLDIPEYFFKKPLEHPEAVTMRIFRDDAIKETAKKRSQSERMLDLYKASREISLANTTDAVCETVLKALCGTMRISRAAVLLETPDGQMATRMAYTPLGKAETGTFSFSKTLVDTATKQKLVIITRDASHDPRFSAAQSIIRGAVHAALCLPMSVNGNITGVLYMESTENAAYLKEDADMCELLAGHAAIAIENIELANKVAEEKTIRTRLRRYLPNQIVEDIIAKKESIPPNGTRTEISVMFADFRNFTAMASNLPPEEVLRMLNTHLSAMTDIVFRHCGVLDKYLGDGMMALFGLRKCDVPHQEMAVRCAIEIRDLIAARLLETSRRMGVPVVEVGIGINSGPVVIGHVGSEERADYTAIGDTVNVASRTEGEAGPGEILINENTYAPVRELIMVRILPPRQIKGKSEPLQFYAVEGLKNPIQTSRQ